MTNVKELTKKLVSEEEELVGSYLSMMNFHGFMNMDPKEFEMMKATLTLMDTMNELLVEYARVIEGMDAKLNHIVSEIEKGEQA